VGVLWPGMCVHVFLFVCMYVWPLMKVHEHMQRGESCCSFLAMLVCKGLCMCHACVCCFCPNDDITLQLDNSCEQVFRRGLCRRPHRPGGLGQVVLQDASSGCLIACEVVWRLVASGCALAWYVCACVFVCVHVCMAPDESARTYATRGVLLFVSCDAGLQGVVHVPCLCLLFLP
jgi:hypothetical protein